MLSVINLFNWTILYTSLTASEERCYSIWIKMNLAWAQLQEEQEEQLWKNKEKS